MRRSSKRSRIEAAKSNSQDGFVLIEVIIAFVILALGMGTTMVAVATAMRSDAYAHDGRIMDRIAQARLESAGITEKLAIGSREGRIGRYIWKETVTPARIGERKQSRATGQADGGAPLVWIEIVVHTSDGKERKGSVLKLASQVLQ